MVGSLNVKRIWRGGRGGGDHERAGKSGGGGTRDFSKEDIRRGSGGSDFEGGWGRALESVTRRIQRGYRIIEW